MTKTMNKQLGSKKAIVLYLISALFYFYEFLLQVSPGIMVPDIMHTFSVSAKQVGYLATWYFAAYALMQLPAGALFDRFGARILLTVAALMCSIGTFMFACTHSFAILELSRFVTGIGSAFALLGTLVIAATWFPPHRFALLSGILVTIGMLGAIFGEKPLALMLLEFGWHETLLILAFIGLGLSVVLFVVIRDKTAAIKGQHQPLVGVGYILKDKQSWYTAIYGALIYAATASLGALWGVSFLRVTYGFSNPQAAGFISMIFVGWALGSPLFGFISDLIRKRKPSLYFSAAISTVLISIIIYWPHLHYFVLASLFVAFGIASSAFLPSFSIIRELHPAKYSGTALGMMNMLNNLGGASIPPIIGYLLEMHDKNVVQVLDYTPHDFRVSLIILPIGLFAALLLVPFIRETNCKVRIEK